MSEQKKCNYCAMMIPGDAEICPHCRKRLKTSFTTKTIMAIIAVLGIVYFCSVPSFESYKDKARESNKKAADKTTTEVAKTENEKLTDKGKKIKTKYPGWNNYICNTVAEKKIYVGMTTDQVRAAWGRPYKINSSSYKNSEHEQWVMSESGSTYVYFENGIMTALQQPKKVN